MTVNIDEILQYLTSGESESLEFKESLSLEKEILKTIGAFSIKYTPQA